MRPSVLALDDVSSAVCVPAVACVSPVAGVHAVTHVSSVALVFVLLM